MSNDSELQARLAVEYMSANHCQQCHFYCYSKTEQECLFHSVSLDECHVAQLHLKGELHNEASISKARNKG